MSCGCKSSKETKKQVVRKNVQSDNKSVRTGAKRTTVIIRRSFSV